MHAAGALAGAVGKIFGAGDYKVTSNSLAGGVLPSFSNNGESTVLARREFLGDVKSSVDFSSTSYPINPGVVTTFPWLSRLAVNYEQYKLLGLVFEFKTTCGSAVSSTNNALGVVIMSTQYDAVEPPFLSKVEMEAYMFTSSAVPSESQLHAVECKRTSAAIPVPYVRTIDGAVGDIRMYDWGLFQIATSGMQANNITIGELWVTYHFEFIKPRLPATTLPQRMVFVCESSNGNATATAPVVLHDTHNFNCTMSDITTFEWVFGINCRGFYKITYVTRVGSSAIGSIAADHVGATPIYSHTGSGIIRGLTASEMEVLYGVNFAVDADEPQYYTRDCSYINVAGTVRLQTTTIHHVYVDTTLGGTGTVRTGSCGLSHAGASYAIIERVLNTTGAYGAKPALNPRPTPPTRAERLAAITCDDCVIVDRLDAKACRAL